MLALTVVFVTSNNLKRITLKPNRKVNRTTTHVTVFYVMLIIFASIDHQLERLATIRTINSRAIRAKSHSLTLLFLVEHDSVLGFSPIQIIVLTESTS